MRSQDEPLHPLAVLIFGGFLMGCLLLGMAVGPITNWLDGTQTITVSSVGAAPNCEVASAVGDDACNQTVTVFPVGSLILAFLGVLLIIGWFAVMLLFVVL